MGGPKIDIWSSGVVLYEIVCLKLPFHAGNIAGLVQKIVTARPAALPPRCCEEVREIVASALQRDPEQRPSAQDFLARPALQQRIGSETIPARKANSPTPTPVTHGNVDEPLSPSGFS